MFPAGSKATETGTPSPVLVPAIVATGVWFGVAALTPT